MQYNLDLLHLVGLLGLLKVLFGVGKMKLIQCESHCDSTNVLK
jgi:hypothetical protein